MLQRMLAARGFVRYDYQLIEVGGWEHRYFALEKGAITATLLTEPFIEKALQWGYNLLAKDFEMIGSYQETCGARHWPSSIPTTWSGTFERTWTRLSGVSITGIANLALDILARHNKIHGVAAEHTLAALLHPGHGLYPKAALNMPGVTAALELRADLGCLTRPIPLAEKYVDCSYYQKASWHNRSG